ncbi:MAG: 2-succinyl-5-enolpyruvyl-6-hydroxy-3-cyclohexene-1-carboxylic-acid synthase [Actinomycetota bacterium]|nr:2-succinyl-5-enolpyruvyl-6-hydroxy-3-cyclohexene-1-carboxylic-acid synthase [Actinomycetota bacterium]
MTAGPDVQSAFVATLVDELARGGVRHAVVCPGSRSTPLALGLAAHTGIEVHVRLDERSAAFVALGIGIATGLPAVLVTTSGTAAAEVHAAVVEADLARVPLVVCTADRPPELRGVGAPQTIDQDRLFGGAPRWYADPGVADAASRSSWRSLGARAVAEAVSGPYGPGPVHLNLPFREPLVGSFGVGTAGGGARTEGGNGGPAVDDGRPDGAPWHRVAAAPLPPPADVVAELAERVRQGERGLIVAGAWGGSGAASGSGNGAGGTAGSAGASAVWSFAEAAGWPVLADPRSDAWRDRPGVISAGDLLVRSERFVERNRPELVIRLGAPPASRPLSTWLDGLSASGVRSVVVDPWSQWIDPGRVAHLVVRADPGALCRAVAEALAGAGLRTPAGDDTYAASWERGHRAVQGVLEGALGDSGSEDGLVEPAVARTVVQSLPAGSTLVVSSSMPIRDVETFAAPRPDRVRIVANRGANGIDGVTSTAAGVALAAASGGASGGAAGSGPVVALLGDLAFLHDVSALVHAVADGAAGAGLTLVVVDNGGGGIFSFLPQARELDGDRFEALFGTPPSVDVAEVARGFGLAVDDVGDRAELADVLARCLRSGGTAAGARVVRVRVPGHDANVEAHARLVGAVREELDALS